MKIKITYLLIFCGITLLIVAPSCNQEAFPNKKDGPEKVLPSLPDGPVDTGGRIEVYESSEKQPTGYVAWGKGSSITEQCAKEIIDFTRSYDFPKPGHNVTIRLHIPEEDVSVFGIGYGEMRDCEMGCVSSTAQGIKKWR